MADVFYSRADRAALERGEALPEHGTLTPEDYKDLLQMALDEAVAGSSAGDLIGSAVVGDLEGKYAGVTKNEIGDDGMPTGKYSVEVDWGSRMDLLASDARNGKAYAAQRFSTAFHEVRHVEQRAMLDGNLDPESKLDRELVTQMTVNDLYPSVYKRGYTNTVSEVDADVCGLEGALAFFDAHPEIKERYGFDFRREIMRTDEYDVIKDLEYQVTEAEPEELLDGMRAYRDTVYGAEWNDDRSFADGYEGANKSEKILMERLREQYGIGFEELEGMSNDERNVLLISNAIDVIDDESVRIATNLEDYRTGIVMQTRCDEYIKYENDLTVMEPFVLTHGHSLSELVRTSQEVADRKSRWEEFMQQGREADGIGEQVYVEGGAGGVSPGWTGMDRAAGLGRGVPGISFTDLDNGVDGFEFG